MADAVRRKMYLGTLGLAGALSAVMGQSQPAPPDTLPLKPERKIEFDTDEGTWLSLDVRRDGKTIVFELAGDLYTLPIEGGVAQPLSTGMSFDAQPRYSPDGAYIAFISDRDGADNVWVMKSDGTSPRVLTKEKQASFASPEWTEDGRAVIVSRNVPGLRTFELLMYDTRGGAGVQVTKAKPKAETLPADQHNALGVEASPDGRYLYYATKKGGFAYNVTFPLWQIARRDRHTGDEDVLTQASGSAIRPLLSPDGRTLIYGTRYNTETGLRVRDLSTGEDRWLKYPVQRDDQESRFARDLLPGYAFMPDGKSIVVSYGGKIHRVDLASGTASNIPFRAHVALDLGPKLDFQDRVDDGPSVRARLIQGASVSPDGSTIAFSAFGKLYVAPVAGGSPRRLTTSDEFEFTPSFSGDSKSIFYVTWKTEGGHIMSAVPGPAPVTPKQLTQMPAFYRDPALSPDGTRVVALRAPASSRVEIESEWGGSEPAGLELITMPSSGGATTPFASAKGFSKPHFSREPDRVYVNSRDGLLSLRFDGTDRRTLLKVVGKTPAPEPAPASDVRVSPDGKHVLAAVSTQLFVLPVPPSVGEPPTINVSSAAVPVAKLTDIGVDEFFFVGAGRSIGWTVGATLFTRSLDGVKFGEGEIGAQASPAPSASPTASPSPSPTPKRAEEEATAVTFVVERERARPKGTLFLRGARVISMRDAQGGVIPQGDIIVEGNRITAVGPSGSLAVPPGARVVDVAGKTITPGLIDVHAHWTEVRRRVLDPDSWPFLANLAYGVTTGRDPQTATNDVFAYQDFIDAGIMPGPRAFNTGPGVFSNTDFQSADAAKSVVAKYREYYRTNTLKSYTVGNRKQRQFMVEASRAHRIMPTTEGALDLRLDFTHAIDGFSGTEHALPIVPLYKDMIEVFARSGITYTPTLLVAYGGPWAENYFYETTEVWNDPKLRRFIPTNVLETKAKRRPWFAEDEHVFKKLAAEAAKIARAGGRIGVGGHGQLQGIQCHWELWALAAGGMSAVEALHAGTIAGAEAIGYAQDLGTIEPGKLADLVVLDKDPLENIRNTASIRYVMKNGELFDGETLDVIAPVKKSRTTQWWWKAGPPSPPVGGLQETEIYVAPVLGTGAALKVGTPQNATRRPGYDNQPRFDVDGRSFVYTRGDATGRTDIYRYDLALQKSTVVKSTEESEFSPTPMGDGRYGVIRVELDGTQRLWKMDPNPGRADDLMVTTIRPLGYFAFPEPNVVAAFVLGNPATLQLINLSTEESRVIASNVGRAVHKIPGRAAVSFLHKVSRDEWVIKEVDAKGAVKDIARAPQGREDYAWLGDGTLLISSGAKLLARLPGVDSAWREVGDFSTAGITELSRIAPSPKGDRIAVVGVPASSK